MNDTNKEIYRLFNPKNRKYYYTLYLLMILSGILSWYFLINVAFVVISELDIYFKVMGVLGSLLLVYLFGTLVEIFNNIRIIITNWELTGLVYPNLETEKAYNLVDLYSFFLKESKENGN